MTFAAVLLRQKIIINTLEASGGGERPQNTGGAQNPRVLVSVIKTAESLESPRGQTSIH